MRAICTSIAAIALAAGHAALAQDTEAGDEAEPAKPKVEVIARDDSGKATHVSVNGRENALCSEDVQDSCISPRSAGFDWGTQELDHWPGQTASSLKEQQARDSTAADPGPEGEEAEPETP